MNSIRLFLFYSSVVAVPILAASCARHASLPVLTAADSLAIIEDNLGHRATLDSFFRNDTASPFKRDTSIEYHGLKWFPVNPAFRGLSLLHTYASMDTVIVMGTRGEERRQVRYGYFEFVVPGYDGSPLTIKLNTYKFTPYDSNRFRLYPDNLSVWFTDQTTGAETYNVGRYVDVGDDRHDPNYVYTIDLNKAYNPYCAYSTLYSCAVPRREDHIDLAVRVGELKYHD